MNITKWQQSMPQINPMSGKFDFNQMYSKIYEFYSEYLLQMFGIITFLALLYTAFIIITSGFTERPESNLHRAKSVIGWAILGLITATSAPAILVLILSVI